MEAVALLMAVLAAVQAGDADTGRASAEQLSVISRGHVDIGLELGGDRLTLSVHDRRSGHPEPLDPATVVLHATEDSRISVPADAAFAFLGPPGAPVWILPQIEDPNLLWLGWNTETIPPGAIAGDSLRWSLRELDGPGHLILFTTGAFGEPVVLFNSSDGIDGKDVIDAGIPSHAHGNWAFTAAGEYRVVFETEAVLAGGGETESGPVTFRFRAGSPETAGEPPPGVEAPTPPTQAGEEGPPGDDPAPTPAPVLDNASPGAVQGLPAGGGPAASGRAPVTWVHAVLALAATLCLAGLFLNALRRS
jgi:surface-anchored protein